MIDGTVGAASPADPAHRLPSRLVDDLHFAFGDHHSRAVHAKGIVLEGVFKPNAAATELTRAAVFGQSVPLVARFSNFTGIPTIPDTQPAANPRGLALKFLMPDGANLDVVSHSFNGFPVATAEEFSAFLRALGASGPGSAAPTKLDAFLAAHPIAKAFLTSQKPPPKSFATAAYYGVNSFLFTRGSGDGRYVRYRFLPEAGEAYLDGAAIAAQTGDYLNSEIVRRVDHAPVRFRWYAQVAGYGDAIEDPSIAWPEHRPLVELGTLELLRMGANDAEADKALSFMPGSLLPGIEIADPMVTIRNAAYPVSYHHRQ